MEKQETGQQTLVEGKDSQLAVFSPAEAMIAEYAEENMNLVFDYRDPIGNKEARSHIFKLRKVKTKITDIHKKAKADALEVCRMLDGHKNKLLGKVEDMIAVHDEPIKQIEREEAEAEAERQRLIREAEEKAERERLAEIERREAEVKAREEALAAKKAEEERIEREKRIADEAAARVEAEKKAALEAAEQKRLADLEAERQRAIAEQQAKELAERKRKETEAEAERKRVENKNHRAKIENEVATAFANLKTTDPDDYLKESQCDAIVAAIATNQIPHVTINY